MYWVGHKLNRDHCQYHKVAAVALETQLWIPDLNSGIAVLKLVHLMRSHTLYVFNSGKKYP